ncbi:hypothetical protein FRB97_005042 [Tulasnella sp. 331]|nr:hypothetical protein FRB97_005042 [Tulasnella sp. 331]
MATDLFADIWGDEDEEPTLTHIAPRALSRPRGDSDDEFQPGPPKRPRKEVSDIGTALPPELDALFPADDEDDQPSFGFSSLKPSKDLDQLAKESEARYARAGRGGRAIQPTASTKSSNAAKSRDPLQMARQHSDDDASGTKASATGGKKKDKDAGEETRKPIPKLDETRLLGAHGFKALIPVAKKFKSKGKGHEAADLAKVLEMYQLWSHRMYPKTQFRDTIEKVEKACHSRRMMTSLSVWRDEDKNGPALATTDATTEEGAIEVEDSDDEAGGSHARQFNASGQSMPLDTSSTNSTASRNASSSSSPTRPQSSAATSEIDDAEMDELMADLEGASKSSAAAWPVNSDGIDDDDWAMADEMANEAPTTKTVKLAAPLPNNAQNDATKWDNMLDEDEDFGDLEAFMMEAESLSTQRPAAAGQPQTGISGTQSSSSTTAGAGTDHDDTSTAADIDVGVSLSTDLEAGRKRRESIQKEFEAGWDDMYE